MDVSLVIKLEEFGLEQRDLASAAQVTESYISQLLTRKKAPPSPNRTDIYDKMGKFLKLPNVSWRSWLTCIVGGICVICGSCLVPATPG